MRNTLAVERDLDHWIMNYFRINQGIEIVSKRIFQLPDGFMVLTNCSFTIFNVPRRLLRRFDACIKVAQDDILKTLNSVASSYFVLETTCGFLKGWAGELPSLRVCNLCGGYGLCDACEDGLLSHKRRPSYLFDDFVVDKAMIALALDGAPKCHDIQIHTTYLYPLESRHVKFTGYLSKPRGWSFASVVMAMRDDGECDSSRPFFVDNLVR